ncbi:DUF1439 domain-containing protein [Pseudoxanthomonas indica]|uniref:DUF1439 domain-containing protein n=1 Tax=Pseudoxanthomonas indica TaxID=428993 RepID=A0A1T5LLK6_9GAMM|nr:DUF1439 domain-containing protein [Pseudoxanthomonas indica]GGD36681.1 hypothetical protein GCM10007235_05870 [Pseudoxanthomonas indica]SKC76842.1 Protein of unknown function [Pseudoxanthomonas indica]
MTSDLYTLKRLRRSRRALAWALAASVATLPFPLAVTAQEPAFQQTAEGFAVGAQQLQTAMASQFPHSESLLGGLADLTFSKPAVAIPNPGSRIQLDMDYQLASRLDGSQQQGRLRVLSGLRYNPGSHGLHLLNPEVQSVRANDGSNQVDEQTRALINALLQDYAKQQPVYQLDAATVAQIPGTLTADAIRIEKGQVHLRLGQ